MSKWNDPKRMCRWDKKEPKVSLEEIAARYKKPAPSTEKGKQLAETSEQIKDVECRTKVGCGFCRKPLVYRDQCEFLKTIACKPPATFLRFPPVANDILDHSQPPYPASATNVMANRTQNIKYLLCECGERLGTFFYESTQDPEVAYWKDWSKTTELYGSLIPPEKVMYYVGHDEVPPTKLYPPPTRDKIPVVVPTPTRSVSVPTIEACLRGDIDAGDLGAQEARRIWLAQRKEERDLARRG